MEREKIQLRKRMREKLSSMLDGQRLEISRQLTQRMAGQPLWGEAALIGLYSARGDEVETAGLRDEQKRFAFPKVSNGELCFIEVQPGEDLLPGKWNIPEPAGAKCVVPDLILVPGLAFDRGGGRLGRGLGFYDRWIAAHPGVCTWGVCFAFQIVDRVPLDVHDQPVDAVFWNDMLPDISRQ